MEGGVGAVRLAVLGLGRGGVYSQDYGYSYCKKAGINSVAMAPAPGTMAPALVTMAPA